MKKTIMKIGIDMLMLVSFLALRMVFWTGIPLHEILGLGLAVMVAVHLALNGNWIKTLPQKMRSKTRGKGQRKNLVVNVLLAVSFVVVMATGFCISQFVLPANTVSTLMVGLHKLSGNLCIFLMILHLVFHATYLKAVFKKIVTPKKAMETSANTSFHVESIVLMTRKND